MNLRELRLTPPRAALLACRVFEREIAPHAAGARHLVETRFFAVGLHDRPDHLHAMLQAQIDALDGRAAVRPAGRKPRVCRRPPILLNLEK
jgi:hypothetical protein